ncbi:TetR/AcrR family transcriptional regulator [Citricoccus nitrophenolicus]|uniref:TetR/AcrR family transcriptional regulator n=1 Tax=Citricoccus nitrophenolicus TaxID=863575 RepID=A0ABV0IKH4_9MICC|nr:TetR/AcrR family transcriptional regulator [Citricoccus sp. I39-566]WMY78366.1 TetR/AcrR family transcriptional regulator [Citricoccus sp. I39-566]
MSVEQRGRPRSEKSRVAVLEATAGLMVDCGYEDLTIEGIAAAAGVGKQTIYRWWGSKAGVVVEALAEGYLQMPLTAPADSGDLRGDLRGWLLELKGEIEAPEVSRLVQAIMSALTSAGETSSAIHESLIQPIMDGLDARFGAHDRAHPGQLTAPPQFLAETVGASLLLHVMFARPLTVEWIDQLLDLVVPGSP